MTGRLIWVEGERKCSFLFIRLLKKLRVVYPHAQVIHVVLDNYRIHSSRITQQAVAGFVGQPAESQAGHVAQHRLDPALRTPHRGQDRRQGEHPPMAAGHVAAQAAACEAEGMRRAP